MRTSAQQHTTQNESIPGSMQLVSFHDNRAEAVAQRKLGQLANQAVQRKQLNAAATPGIVQRVVMTRGQIRRGLAECETVPEVVAFLAAERPGMDIQPELQKWISDHKEVVTPAELQYAIDAHGYIGFSQTEGELQNIGDDEAAEESLNEVWHAGSKMSPEYDYGTDDEVMQMARKGNTISGPKSYKASDGNQLDDIAYKTKGDGNIDFAAPHAAPTGKPGYNAIKSPVVDLAKGASKKDRGVLPSKKEIHIPSASRGQHFAVANGIIGNGCGYESPPDHTWHHLSERYKMVLVDRKVHSKHGHNGGVHIW